MIVSYHPVNATVIFAHCLRMKIIGMIPVRSNQIGLSNAYRRARALPPRRGMIIKPRATPWVWNHKETPALKGRHKDWLSKRRRTVEKNGLVISPFQGLCVSHSLPRALPWAAIELPFRAKIGAENIHLIKSTTDQHSAWIFPEPQLP